jgi:hyperosmotically inducible protein
VSTHDDDIRAATYRAVYGSPTLNRYAWEMVASIHIIVKNGHVTLEGAVATEGDRNTAAIEANGVPGVFSVRNELQIDPRI